MNKSEYKKYTKNFEQNIFNDITPDEYTCIVCKKNIVKVLYSNNKPSPIEQEKGMWTGGTVEKISFSYGSVLDTESYYFALCDECAKKLKNNNIIKSYKSLKKELNDKL